MSGLDWMELPAAVRVEIRLGLLEAGLTEEQAGAYLAAAGETVYTRTHGRREVAFLNLAWEDVLAADWLADLSQSHQTLLCGAVNSRPCRCASYYPEINTPLAFLRRCLKEHEENLHGTIDL